MPSARRGADSHFRRFRYGRWSGLLPNRPLLPRSVQWSPPSYGDPEIASVRGSPKPPDRKWLVVAAQRRKLSLRQPDSPPYPCGEKGYCTTSPPGENMQLWWMAGRVRNKGMESERYPPKRRVPLPGREAALHSPGRGPCVGGNEEI